MADPARYDRLREGFSGLLQELSRSWPDMDISYVQDEVGHGEYGDALENLIALGLRNGHGFGVGQARRMEALAMVLGLEGSPWLARLREAGRAASGHAA